MRGNAPWRTAGGASMAPGLRSASKWRAPTPCPRCCQDFDRCRNASDFFPSGRSVDSGLADTDTDISGLTLNLPDTRPNRRHFQEVPADAYVSVFDYPNIKLFYKNVLNA